jgi:hypothetical protein
MSSNTGAEQVLTVHNSVPTDRACLAVPGVYLYFIQLECAQARVLAAGVHLHPLGVSGEIVLIFLHAGAE